MSSILSLIEPLAKAVGLEVSSMFFVLVAALLIVIALVVGLWPKKTPKETPVATLPKEGIKESLTKAEPVALELKAKAPMAPALKVELKREEPKPAIKESIVKAEPKPAIKKAEPKKQEPKPVKEAVLKTEPKPVTKVAEPKKVVAQPFVEPKVKESPTSKAEPSLIEPPAPKEEPLVSPAKSLGAALKNTRGGFMAKLASLFSRGAQISDEDFEEMEAILFSADIGAKTAQKLLDALKERMKNEKVSDKAAIHALLKEEMRAIFKRAPYKEQKINSPLAVYIFVGVNGAGKTTSIGKLGAQMAAQGQKVFFGAGDTFRAAAVAQLSIWGERSQIEVVKGKENADSASVLFDAITKAKLANADVILCDTAGRLHTKAGLMDELKKVHRVLNKAQEGAPHEVFLVIDATMGQNAIAQAREFQEATPLTGIVLSKLDGTAKGGVALGIVDELMVPIRFVGIGEKAEDLKPFDPDEFVDALFSDN